MDDRFYNNSFGMKASEETLSRVRAAFMSKVYTWMFGGLSVTGITAYATFDSGIAEQLGGSIFILMLATLGLVFFLSARIHKMSATTATLSYLAYALLNGVVFSTIFLTYQLGSIAQVFFITAGMFGALSAFGYFTKRDLGPMGTFMYMGLVGIVIMSLINIFLQSSVLSMVFSIIGIVVFAGLTAYDTQKLKEIADENFNGEDIAKKAVIMGALTLYLDFINLFLMLLRLFGRRD